MKKETLAQMLSCEFYEITVKRILLSKKDRSGTSLIMNRCKNLLFTISSNDIFEMKV